MIITILITAITVLLLTLASIKTAETYPNVSWKLFQLMIVVMVIGSATVIAQGLVSLFLLMAD